MPALPKIVLAIAGLTLGSCGGSAGRGDGDTTPPAADNGPPHAVELAEITVYENDQAMVRLHADGTSEVARNLLHDTTETALDPGPTVAADGTVSLGTTEVARVNPDGSIVDLLTQSNMPITLTSDRVTFAHDGTVSGFALAASGKVSKIEGAMTTELPIRVDGADTPLARRTVLAFLVVLFQKPDE
jgi:hypothetical protein